MKTKLTRVFKDTYREIKSITKKRRMSSAQVLKEIIDQHTIGKCKFCVEMDDLSRGGND